VYPPRRLAIRPARLAGWGERELGQADRSGGVDLARAETSQLGREMEERKTQDPDYIYKKRIGLAACGVVERLGDDAPQHGPGHGDSLAKKLGRERVSAPCLGCITKAASHDRGLVRGLCYKAMWVGGRDAGRAGGRRHQVWTVTFLKRILDQSARGISECGQMTESCSSEVLADNSLKLKPVRDTVTAVKSPILDSQPVQPDDLAPSLGLLDWALSILVVRRCRVCSIWCVRLLCLLLDHGPQAERSPVVGSCAGLES